MTPSLGAFSDTGAPATISVDRLVESRMLLQAGSGGGKSWALRRILEQTAGKVQQIVIDPDGEFATLREKFDYVIAAAHDGDALAHPRTAALLARRLLETGVSAIIDIYDLKKHERLAFVRILCETIVDAPKDLWHPALIVIDEAHVFCLSADTELLTRDGFISYDEIVPGKTEAVCFDPVTGAYSYGDVQRLIIRDHDGPMVHLKSDGLDSFSTPEHRVVLKRVQRAVGRYQLYDWTFCEAAKVPTCVGVPIGGAPVGPGVEGLSLRDARILGWIITDGYLCGPRLGLEQSHATVKGGIAVAEEMRAVLAGVEGVSQYSRKARQTISNGRVSSHAPTYSWYFAGESSAPFLRWLGTEIHRVPRQLLDGCDRKQLAALYQGLLEGDGTCHKGSWVGFYPGQSSDLADDFQEVAMRLGISTTKHWEKSIGQWQVRIADERSMHWVRRPARTEYSGRVWDITVPTGAFVARRNGRIFVTGNCPEVDKAESAGAVVDLASRGRKRGYSLLAATQRIAKLSKDCAAELHNKLIGLTTLDVDVKRAAFELGLQPAEAMRELRALQPGEFFGFGPALWPTVRKLKTGDVQTTHPKAGKRSLQAPPKPTEAIKAVLPKLADLPKEAEAEARSIEELKRELASARRELALAARQRPTPAPAAPTVSRQDLKTAEDRGYARGHTDGAREAQRAATTHLRTVRARLHQALDAALAAAPTPALPGAPAPAQLAKPRDAAPAPSQSRPVPAPIPARTAEPPRPVRHAGNGTADPAIGRGGKQRILATLAQHGRMPERRLGLLAGLSTRGGTWSTYLSALRQAGYIEGSDELAITEAGLAALGSYETLPTGEALIDYWRGRVGGGGRRAIFDALVAAYPNAVDQDELAAAVNLSSAGGTWSTYLSTLRTMELITGKRELRASDELFG